MAIKYNEQRRPFPFAEYQCLKSEATSDLTTQRLNLKSSNPASVDVTTGSMEYECYTNMFLPDITTVTSMPCLNTLTLDYGTAKCKELCPNNTLHTVTDATPSLPSLDDPTYGYWEETDIT